MDRSENPYPYFDLKITSNCCCFSDELLLFDNSSRWVISDISRVFLGQTGAYIESRLAPSGNIFKSCASRCSKNALPGPDCSKISLQNIFQIT